MAREPSPDEPTLRRLHVSTQHGPWLLAILVGAFTLRAINLAFNSAFEGEGFMILMGRSALARSADLPAYLRIAFGWYLWPAATALANDAGGLTGVRLLAVASGTAAVLALFLLTRRLFDERSGLVAALLLAVFTPAILASRIATADAAGMAALTFAMLAIVRAWQSGTATSWTTAAMLAVVCVLVKHSLIAIIPPLCILAPFLDRRRGTLYSLGVLAVLAAYGFWYRDAVLAMVAAVSSASGGGAMNGEVVRQYVANGVDVWLLVVAAAAALLFGNRETRIVVILLGLTAFFLAIAPTSSAFDRHAWSYAIYPVIVLLPAAAAGMLRLADHLVRNDRTPAAVLLGVVAATVNLLSGQGLTPARGGLPAIWPNSTVVSSFLHDRVQYGQRVLLDDAAVRYLLADLTPQARIADEHAFQFNGQTAPNSYARAADSGHFDYIVLDGNDTDRAQALLTAVEPSIAGRYVERLRALQPNTGLEAVIYERILPPVTRPADAPIIVVDSPHSGTTIVAAGEHPSTIVSGHVEHAPRGARLRVDVGTDDWYQQGDIAPLTDPRGGFSRRVVLGGEGAHRCSHLLRFRLIGNEDRILHEVFVAGVKRTSPDSAAIPCPPT